MSELQIFSNHRFGDIRTIEEEGKVLFCGSDVARALGYNEPHKAVARHCKGWMKRPTPTNGGIQQMLFIPEGDIYRLAAKSELPEADEFERWIFDEVLPSIRKHGAYMTEETLQEAILNPDYLLKIVTALKDETDRRKALEAANTRLIVDNQIMAPKAEYFDQLVERGTLLSLRESAKELGIPPKKFVDELLARKYLYRNKSGKLLPYEEKNNGLFELKESVNTATGWSGTQTLTTPKGRDLFRQWGM